MPLLAAPMINKVRCPKCGQLVPPSAIDGDKKNCFYCSGVPTATIRASLEQMKAERAEEAREEESQRIG